MEEHDGAVTALWSGDTGTLIFIAQKGKNAMVKLCPGCKKHKPAITTSALFKHLHRSHAKAKLDENLESCRSVHFSTAESLW